MKKTPIFQSPKEGEKEELNELLSNIKRVIKIRYIVIGGFALLFSVLKLIGIYPMLWLSILLLFLLLAFVALCDLLLKKTKLKKTVTRASIIYFIFQIAELILVLISIELFGVMPFIGALVLTLILLVSYFSYTRRNYLFAIVIFYIVTYTVVITFEYLGILIPKDTLNIGINISRNQGVFILSLTTGVLVMVSIFLTVNIFSRRLRDSLKKLTQKEKELQEAKRVLEVKVRVRTKELEKERVSLEEKVEERTKKLQGKVGELERFQKITVGRELKMIELKKEIKRVNKKLEKYTSGDISR